MSILFAGTQCSYVANDINLEDMIDSTQMPEILAEESNIPDEVREDQSISSSRLALLEEKLVKLNETCSYSSAKLNEWANRFENDMQLIRSQFIPLNYLFEKLNKIDKDAELLRQLVLTDRQITDGFTSASNGENTKRHPYSEKMELQYLVSITIIESCLIFVYLLILFSPQVVKRH